MTKDEVAKQDKMDKRYVECAGVTQEEWLRLTWTDRVEAARKHGFEWKWNDYDFVKIPTGNKWLDWL